ncbi:MAG: MiaB/RimO family radical SAM methylthiotransferase [Acidobacteriota bacterium]
MRVYFTNLGCKLNQAEVDHLARRFVAAGHRLAGALAEADLHVVNSCTVTHLAARDSRKTARRGARVRPTMRTVLTGCYATDALDEAAELAGVDLVVPNPDKDQLLERVHDAFPELAATAVGDPTGADGPADDDIVDAVPVPYVPLDVGLARALVKVEDGCNMRCAFCIIPSTRGRQRSRARDAVADDVRTLARGGYREIVITGVQISEYRDDDGHRLYDLVRHLLDALDDAAVPTRLRLTSIAPWKFDRRLLALWQHPRLCRHVHMSLQSGATATLRRMRRPYSAPQYAELAAALREAIPGLALTTDVIVGFPGEDDAEFADSLAFVERLAFARPHVFTYSVREGTHAATLPDPVPHAVKKARTARMLAVAQRSMARFHAAHVGTALPVLWEQIKRDRWTGLTDNYLRVRLAPDDPAARSLRPGELRPAQLVAADETGLDGRLTHAPDAAARLGLRPSPPPDVAAVPSIPRASR